MNYTYLLRCADNSLYCGWTNRLEERIAAHNAGKGAKYTKSRRPVELCYYESFDTKEEAMKREAAIKKLNRTQKEKLAAGFADRQEERLSQEISSGQSGQSGQFGQESSAMAGLLTGFSIIISPAKKMQVRNDELPYGRLPVFFEEAEMLLHRLREYTEPELKKLFAANDSITHENYLRYREMDLRRNLTPAVLSYVGIQYQYMAPQIFSLKQWEYVCEHLRILSGFYGILRADDGIVPYRLEMQARLSVGEDKELYSYWGDKPYRELIKCGRTILNLASKEYSKVIERYLTPEDRFVTCVFGTEKDGSVKVKATEAKMARGEMVRFLAERDAQSLDTVKEFDRLDFAFCPERSTDNEFVFIKQQT